jgi:gamma-glutamyltranspeptidase/glutathione hydrolase
LLSEAYWKEQTERIDPDRARDFDASDIAQANAGDHTTHFVVADDQGNVVSATVTLGNLFGSRIMPRGTGIWLNNSLAYCTFEPKGNPMDAHPGRRKLSSDAPSFVMRDGRPWIALGTPGGHTITQTVAQMIMNVVDFEMDIRQAIAAPRIAFNVPHHLDVEPEIPEAVRDRLSAMGHQVRVRNLGKAHGLAIEYDGDGAPVRFTGAADPRGAGLAAGY